MYWFIIMCVVVTLAGAISIKRNKVAKLRFLEQYPDGNYESSISGAVKNFIHNGQRIQALKQFRRDTGLGLKDSKELLESIIQKKEI